MIYAIVGLVLLWAVTALLAVRFWTDGGHLKEALERANYYARGVLERERDAEERHVQIEAGLREQIQHLAQSLATLRVDKGASPDIDRFVENPKPREPLSQQLTDFLLGIEYESARQLVEEEIDALRLQDHTDEQIYDIISKGID